jgi:hypothetical protein
MKFSPSNCILFLFLSFFTLNSFRDMNESNVILTGYDFTGIDGFTQFFSVENKPKTIIFEKGCYDEKKMVLQKMYNIIDFDQEFDRHNYANELNYLIGVGKYLDTAMCEEVFESFRNLAIDVDYGYIRRCIDDQNKWLNDLDKKNEISGRDYQSILYQYVLSKDRVGIRKFGYFMFGEDLVDLVEIGNKTKEWLNIYHSDFDDLLYDRCDFAEDVFIDMGFGFCTFELQKKIGGDINSEIRPLSAEKDYSDMNNFVVILVDFSCP